MLGPDGQLREEERAALVALELALFPTHNTCIETNAVRPPRLYWLPGRTKIVLIHRSFEEGGWEKERALTVREWRWCGVRCGSE